MCVCVYIYMCLSVLLVVFLAWKFFMKAIKVYLSITSSGDCGGDAANVYLRKCCLTHNTFIRKYDSNLCGIRKMCVCVCVHLNMVLFQKYIIDILQLYFTLLYTRC